MNGLKRLSAYLALAKPRIVELLLVTTVPSMMVAARGWPGAQLVVSTLLGGSLAAGGANALNNVLDRDIDRVMRRTAHRPVASGEVTAGRALLFGLTLATAGFGVLWATSNLLAAALAGGAVGFYVVAYTLLLKRTTSQNIVIGGAAGAVPVLVGWAAVTGSVEVPALVLFAVVFFWTPPHFWALALRYEDDYRRAGVPMLPVTGGRASTLRQMTAHSVLMVAASVALVPLADTGWVYGLAAVALGAAFLHRLRRVCRGVAEPLELFRCSIAYLAALFAALAIDVLVS